MLAFFVVALVGSAVARPQSFATPFNQRLLILPATSSSSFGANPIRNIAPSALSPASPALARLTPVIHDSRTLAQISPVSSVTVPLRTVINDASSIAPIAQPALVLAPVRRVISNSALIPSAAQPGPALAPLRSVISNAALLPPAAQPAPALAPVRTVISNAALQPSVSQPAPFNTVLNDAAGLSPITAASPALVPLRSVNIAPISAAAAPALIRPQITTVQRTYLADESGQFSSSHLDSAGSSHQETGRFAPSNDGRDRVLVKSGSFSYTSPEGTPISVSYTADALGFHPTIHSQPLSA